MAEAIVSPGTDPVRDVLRLPPDGGSRWIVTGLLAAIVLITLLATAAGLGAAGVARLVDDRQAARLTVQVDEGDAARILAAIGTMPGVLRATPVDRARLLRLLRPWGLEQGPGDDLPIPALIDIDLHDPAAAPAVEHRLRATGAVIRIDRATTLLRPVADLMHGLMRIATATVAILLLAAAATVWLAVRGGLATHRETIAVMHRLGATDGQLAGLFRRRIATQATVGAAIGTVAACAFAVPGRPRIAALGSALAGGATLRAVDWVMIAAIPPAVVALAMLTAHLTAGPATDRPL